METGSPKIILKTVYKAGMINDEELWMKALEARNNVACAYNKDVTYMIVDMTKDNFYDMFVKLKADTAS